MPCCTTSSSDLILYSGPTLSCIGVNTNDNITIALQKINETFCNSSGGGDQDLQSVLEINNETTESIVINSDLNVVDVLTISATSIVGNLGEVGNNSDFMLNGGALQLNQYAAGTKAFYTHDITMYLYPDGGTFVRPAKTVSGFFNLLYPSKDGTLATISDIFEILYATSLSFSTYANDAAADADTNLPSGALYKITGNRQLFQKP